MESYRLTELIGRYSHIVFRVAFSYIGNHADAEDIMQDVFIKLCSCKKTFESEEHIKAWLLRVTVNQCKTSLKLCKKAAYEPIETAEHIPSPEKREENSLLPLVMKLSPKLRSVLYLYYYEDYSVKELSNILGINVSSVTTRLMRARQQLKKLLEKEDYDEL